DLAAIFVGLADDATFGHRFMGQEAVLHLRPGNVVAGRNDHVVGPRLVPEVTLLVLDHGVAGEVPAVLDILALTFVGEVPASGRPLDSELAGRAARHLPAVVVDDPCRIARNGYSGCAGPDLVSLRCEEDVQHLGRAEPVDQRDAERVAYGLEGRL